MPFSAESVSLKVDREVPLGSAPPASTCSASCSNPERLIPANGPEVRTRLPSGSKVARFKSPFASKSMLSLSASRLPPSVPPYELDLMPTGLSVLAAMVAGAVLLGK